MIVPSSGVKVLIAMKPVDFRKGMDGLAAVVHETLGANPFGGVIYVFRSKRADRVTSDRPSNCSVNAVCRFPGAPQRLQPHHHNSWPRDDSHPPIGSHIGPLVRR